MPHPDPLECSFYYKVLSSHNTCNENVMHSSQYSHLLATASFPCSWSCILDVCCRFNVSVLFSHPNQSPVLLTFEEDDDLEASELKVSHVSSFQKSARYKVH